MATISTSLSPFNQTANFASHTNSSSHLTMKKDYLVLGNFEHGSCIFTVTDHITLVITLEHNDGLSGRSSCMRCDCL